MRDRRVAYAAAGISVALVIASVWALRSTGLRATYYIDPDWQTPAYTIVDRRINLDTLTGNAPISPDQPFSVRWFGYLNIPRDGTYTFSLKADGIATASLTIAQDSSEHGQRFAAVDQPVDLGAGAHAIAVSYSHRRGRYGLEFLMATEGEQPRPVSSTSLSPRPRSSLGFRAVAFCEIVGALVAGIWFLAACVWTGRQVTPLAGFTLAIATILFAVAVVFDRPDWIRGPAPYPISWQWDYRNGDALARIMPALVGAAGVVAAIAWLSVGRASQNSRLRARLGLTGAIVAGCVFQLGMLHLGQGGAIATVGERTRNDIYTSYFGVAADKPDVRTLLANYSTMLPSFPVHARTHPPGAILYYRAVIDAVETSPTAARRLMRSLASIDVPVRRVGVNGEETSVLATAAVISGLGTVAFGLLTCVLIGRIANAAGADALSAARAGALWVLCPAAAFFSPTVESINTFLVAASCAMGCGAVTAATGSKRIASALGAGVAAGLALFFSFGAGPMLAAAAGVVFATIARPPIPWRRIAFTSVLALAAVAVVFAVPMAYGFNLIETFRVSMDLHRGHYMPKGRLLWLGFNLLDYSNFLGWPLVAWCATFFVRNRDWWASRLALVTIMAIGVIDIADLTRSEVGRLWMPLMPLAFAGIGVAASTHARRFDFVWVALLLAVCSIAIGLHWSP